MPSADDPKGLFESGKPPEGGFFQNFAIMIPSEAMHFPIQIEDPLGVPIYAGCGAEGLCACTGRCRVIIGHTTDPIKMAAYRESIKKHNEDVGKFHTYRETYGGNWEGDSIQFITNRKKDDPTT